MIFTVPLMRFMHNISCILEQDLLVVRCVLYPHNDLNSSEYPSEYATPTLDSILWPEALGIPDLAMASSQALRFQHPGAPHDSTAFLGSQKRSSAAFPTRRGLLLLRRK